MPGMRPKVHTEKHIVQFSLAAIAAGAIGKFDLASAVAVPTAADEVREGSTISALYAEFWITSDDAAQGTQIACIFKKPPKAGNMSAAEIASLNSYEGKNQIFETHMGLTPPNVQSGTPIFRHWLKIPKSKQRMELGSFLTLNVLAQSNGVSICGFVLYKEQY